VSVKSVGSGISLFEHVGLTADPFRNHIFVMTCCKEELDNDIIVFSDKSLAQPGRKKARKHVRNARDFNNIETRAVIKFLFL